MQLLWVIITKLVITFFYKIEWN